MGERLLCPSLVLCLLMCRPNLPTSGRVLDAGVCKSLPSGLVPNILTPNIPLIYADGAKIVEPTSVPTHQDTALASPAVRSVVEFVFVTNHSKNEFTF